MNSPVENDFLTELKKALARLHRTGSSVLSFSELPVKGDALLPSIDKVSLENTSSEKSDLKKIGEITPLAEFDDVDENDHRPGLPASDDVKPCTPRYSIRSVHHDSMRSGGQLFRINDAARSESRNGRSERSSCVDATTEDNVNASSIPSSNATLSAAAVTSTTTSGVFYGELSCVLQKRSEHGTDASLRVLEMENRPRTGTSVMYFGRGEAKRGTDEPNLSKNSTSMTRMEVVAADDNSFERSITEQTLTLITGDSYQRNVNTSDLSTDGDLTTSWSTVVRRRSSAKPREDVDGGTMVAAQSIESVVMKVDDDTRSPSAVISDLDDCLSRQTSIIKHLSNHKRRNFDDDVITSDVSECHGYETAASYRVPAHRTLQRASCLEELSNRLAQQSSDSTNRLFGQNIPSECDDVEESSSTTENSKQTRAAEVPSRAFDSCDSDFENWRTLRDVRMYRRPSKIANATAVEIIPNKDNRGLSRVGDPVASMLPCSWISDDQHLSDSTASTSGTDRQRLSVSSMAVACTKLQAGEWASMTSLIPDCPCLPSDTSSCSTMATAESSAPNAALGKDKDDTDIASQSESLVQRNLSTTSFCIVHSENDVIDSDAATSVDMHKERGDGGRENQSSYCGSVDLASTGDMDDEWDRSASKDLQRTDPDFEHTSSSSRRSDIPRLDADALLKPTSSVRDHPDNGNGKTDEGALKSCRTAADFSSTSISGFSTFPLQRLTQVRYCSGTWTTGYQDDPDVITNLMITHSGDPICVGLLDSADESRATPMTSHSELASLSVPLTVPVPTSFHQVGNNLGCQQVPPELEKLEKPTIGSMVMPSWRRCTSSDDQSTRSSSDNRSRITRNHRVDRRRPGVASGSHINHHVNWSSSSETGGSNGDTPFSRLRVSSSDGYRESSCRGPSDSLLEADISAGSSFDEPTNGRNRCQSISANTRALVGIPPTSGDVKSGDRRHQQHHGEADRKLGRNWRLSQSPLMRHQQMTYCVNSDKQLVRLDLVSRQRRKRHRGLHRRPPSADDVLMDRGDVVSSPMTAGATDVEDQNQTDDESWRQNSAAMSCDDELERSLIEYVKNDEMTNDMRTLYRHQLDSTMATGVTWNRTGKLKPASASSLLDQLTCCFVCNYGASSASVSSAGFGLEKKQVKCCGTTEKNKSSRRLPTIADYTTVPVTSYGLGLAKGIVDQTSDFYVDTKGLRGSLKVQVDGPSHSVKCYAESVTDCRYRIYYLPTEVGIYTINITWNDHHLDGSPFHAKVVDPRQVIAVGGWNTLFDKRGQLVLEVGINKKIEFDVRHAGPGKLTTVIESPIGELEVEVLKTELGRYSVSFAPQTEGVHHMLISWSGVPIPRSPLVVIAIHSATSVDTNDSFSDASRSAEDMDTVRPDRVLVIATSPAAVPSDSTQPNLCANQQPVLLSQQLATNEIRAQQNIEFIIDGSQGAGPGVPTVKLIGLKEELDVVCHLLSNNRYTCICAPQLPGAYLLEVMWSGRHANGSPFKLTVLPSGDASQVACYIDAQHRPSIGSELKVHICTDNAGPGELSVCCAGPQTMAPCKLIDHQNGHFSLHIRPLEGGMHHLFVQFNGMHVPGSPFDIRVLGRVDASKVSVSGSGIRDGVLSNFCSYFVVDTTGAGIGQLTVRIRGPKGAFRVEMMRHHSKDRTILCRFDPTEAGQYTIHIKWSGNNITGSPFIVNIFSTAEELDNFQKNAALCQTTDVPP